MEKTEKKEWRRRSPLINSRVPIAQGSEPSTAVCEEQGGKTPGLETRQSLSVKTKVSNKNNKP